MSLSNTNSPYTANITNTPTATNIASQNFIPNIDGVYDFGSSTNKYNNVYCNTLNTVKYDNVTINYAKIVDAQVLTGHNNSADIVDLGLAMEYKSGTTKFSGIIRDATDSKIKLVKDSSVLPNETVNLDTLARADLQAGDLNVNKVNAIETTNQLVLGSGNTLTINAPSPSASRVITIPDPFTNAKFILSENSGPQTINSAISLTKADNTIIKPTSGGCSLDIGRSGVFANSDLLHQRRFI